MMIINIIIMTNSALCATSCALLLLHVLALCVLYRSASTPAALEAVYVLGPLTSIWNHASHHSSVAKWSDRIMMCVGASVDVYYYYYKVVATVGVLAVADAGLALLVLAVAAYIIGAKVYEQRAAHMLAHALIFAAHVCLLAAYT